MAKAVGTHGPRIDAADVPVASALLELATTLEDLGRAQEHVRSAVESSVDHMALLDHLFAAVAKLNPRHAADQVRFLASSIGSEPCM